MPNYQTHFLPNQQMNNQPIINPPPVHPTATPPPTETSLTEVSSLTEIDRQLIQMKKDIAGINRAVIQNKKDTLAAVKTQIEHNLAQQKFLIETTMNTSMNLFFAKQEERKQNK